MERKQIKELLPKVRYVHFRLLDMWFNGLNNTGGATLAYVKDSDNVFCGVGWCSMNDKFVKKTGRLSALSNLVKNMKEDTFFAKDTCTPKVAISYSNNIPKNMKKIVAFLVSSGKKKRE